jgi:hypothetical protein
MAAKKESSGCLFVANPGMAMISFGLLLGVIMGTGALMRECQQEEVMGEPDEGYEDGGRYARPTTEEEGADTAEPQPEWKPHDPAAEAKAAVEAKATALREKILRLPGVQRINWEREWGLGWNGIYGDRYATSGDIGKYKGKTGGDVLDAFGKPDSAIQHGGVSGGAWTYIGLKASKEGNPPQGSVTFILDSGVVTDVRVP